MIRERRCARKGAPAPPDCLPRARGTSARGRGTPFAPSRQEAIACVPEGARNACDASLMETARDLTLRLRDLLRREHGALADFLLTLAVFDERRLWAELEYGSLFDFLHRELGLSKGAAFYRKTAVALVREFGAVEEALRSGKLCLMTVVEVARVLTPENA